MARKDFHHPFKPYDVQQQFMEAVYDCIEDGRVGIFESPTGTGKSLSLICGSLTWLREHKRKAFDESVAGHAFDDDDPPWLVEHAREQRRREARQLRADLEARLNVVRQKDASILPRQSDDEPPSKRRKQHHEGTADDKADDLQFMLDEYESDDGTPAKRSNTSTYSPDTMELMQSLGMLDDQSRSRTSEDDPEELKVFFCSRTHSQLSQLVGELRRVKLPPGLPPESESAQTQEDIKHVPLGSRKNLCINPKVAKLPSQSSLNERCIELQQPSIPQEQKCPYSLDKENQDVVLDFADHVLARVRDIEDIAGLGRKMHICPYYASRAAIRSSEIVTLPYPLLLQKSARDALGISLKHHVVVIDEAHNLINALEGIYTTQISEHQLRRARESLMTYVQKFRNRLKGSNRMYVTQVIRVIDALLQSITGLKGSSKHAGVVQPESLLASKAVDQVNMAKLVRYIDESKLARKVEGYVASVQAVMASHGGITTNTEAPALTHIQNFLMCLMNPAKEGRFFWSTEDNSMVIKYLLLDPSEHFRTVVEDTRAVILAGGTMSPMEEYTQQLIPYVPSPRTLSCGHLIPPGSLLVRSIASDQDGLLHFSYKTRESNSIASRIGRAVQSLASAVKGGLVVFFPSYAYLDQITKKWHADSTMQKIQHVKPVFVDSRTAHAEETFKEYRQMIQNNQTGAVLFSVIGGKLSEGINFSDDLGRCVLVIGLPFPNIETPEWKARLLYIDEKAVARGEGRGSASREHVENVCMRSVNQAIGRVIRHKDDWASIVLLDDRYSKDRIRRKLPDWIRGSLPAADSAQSTTLGSVVSDVEAFFAGRQK